MLYELLSAALLATLAASASIPYSSVKHLSPRTGGASAELQILEIAPTSNTCAGAPFPSECATASQAAPYLISAMGAFGITSPPEIAALLSVMAYESGDFKYNTNHYPAPGRPGQGTRNMQMANYNLLYAKSIPALSSSLSAITTASTTDGLSDDQLNAIRALVLPDSYSWGSAAWFLTSQCASSRPALQAGGQAAYESYLTSCVGTTATSDRLAYWSRANSALGIS